MNTFGNKLTRQIHRWVSVVFTVAVTANVVALTIGQGQPADWVTYSPLLPLALLLFTGLYLFVLPYLAKWRSSASARPRGGPEKSQQIAARTVDIR